DLSANSKSNSIKQIDSAKFAQTGEVASRDNRAYMFAYVCEGVYCSETEWSDCEKADKVNYPAINPNSASTPKSSYCNEFKPFGVKYWFPC
ncbi:MAG: hypothetical protein LBH81_02005, partial [Rickettsiales bacterium]|nr:hypothetical protein [Rickettsiales bacterium]